MAQGFGGPGGGFIRVTGRAGIWDFVLVGYGRGDEGECVSANFDVSNGGLDLRHVAGDALASWSACLVMGVLLERCGAGAVERHGAVAIETEFVSRLSKLSVVIGAMNIMASEAGDPSAVHQALHEVIALHAILMSGAIGEMREGHFTEGVIFELPKIAEFESDAKADRPVVILPFDGIGQRTSL